MKRSLFLICLITIFISSQSCKKEEAVPQETELTKNSVTPDLEIDLGQIGLTFETREVVKRRREASELTIEFQNSLLTSLSDTKTIDPFTHMTVFSWNAADVSEEQKEALAKGTPIRIIVKNSGGVTVIDRTEASAIFDQKNRFFNLGENLNIPTVEPFQSISKMKYFLQNRHTGKLLTFGGNNTDKTAYHMAPLFITSTRKLQELTFLPTSVSNVYEIELDRTGPGGAPSVGKILHSVASSGDYMSFGSAGSSTGSSNKFKVVNRGDGYVNIQSMLTGNYMEGIDNGRVAIRLIGRDPERLSTQWRLIAASIDWTIQDLGSKYSTPIMPPAKMEFAFSEEIRNCSPAVTSVSIGTERSKSFAKSVSRQESLQLHSSTTSSATYSAEVTLSGSFYGAGASTTASASFTNTIENSLTRTNTTSNSEEEIESIKISTNRTIDVPAKTTIVAYDAIQFYDEVKVPFVQKIRIKARNQITFQPLSGAEIYRQMSSQFFDGIVTEQGADYIDVSLRGVANFNSWSKIKRELEEGTPCN